MMVKVVRVEVSRSPLLVDWHKGEISSGAVESFNNKAQLAMRKAYSFRTAKTSKLLYIINSALYPNQNLPMNSTDEANFQSFRHPLQRFGERSSTRKPGDDSWVT